MLDATRGEWWTLDEFQLWACRSSQLSLRYHFTEPPHGVPTSWKPTAGTLRSRSIWKTFSLRWPCTRPAREACLCCVAVVAKDSRVSQTSSIPGYFQRISFLGHVEKPLLKTHVTQLKNVSVISTKVEETERRDTNLHFNVGTRLLLIHCRRSGSKKKLPVRRFLLRKKKIWFRKTAEIFMALPPEGKTAVSHHFPYNCPAARVCFMCRFTVCCRYKADARLCVSHAEASAAAWTLRPGSLLPFCEVCPFASKAEVELFFSAVLEAKSWVSHVNNKVSNYSVWGGESSRAILDISVSHRKWACTSTLSLHSSVQG